MPFTGYPLAENKTNDTGAFDDHPPHHNLIAAAANSLQSQIAAALTRIASLVDLGMESVEPTAQRPRPASTQFSDWPTGEPVQVAHTKQTGVSSLLVLWTGSAWCDTTAALFLGSVRVDTGADVEFARFLFNTAGEHQTIVGGTVLGGVAAGAHVYTLRARISIGTLACDQNDRNTLLILEVG